MNLGKKHLDHQNWEALILDYNFKYIEISSIICNIFDALIALHKIHENLHKNVIENMFSFTFLCKFSWICIFAIFVWIFMKFSPKCRSKKLGMIHHFEKVLSHFLIGKGPMLCSASN